MEYAKKKKKKRKNKAGTFTMIFTVDSYLYNTDTSVTRTLGSVPLVSILRK